MKTVIFLGAGASAADGAPVQSQLFKDYFLRPRNGLVIHEMDRELATFFHLVFGIDVDSDDLNRVAFPTFEEALGLIDLAERRRESFKQFDLENLASNSNRLGFMRQYLVMVMVKVIDEKLRTARRNHRLLVQNLKRQNLLDSITFVTTNYDILIDNALVAEDPNRPYSAVDYGLEFTGTTGDPTVPRPVAPKLFKLHGSLNWLYCPTCASLTLTPGEKGIIRLIEDFANSSCPRCESVYLPVIVPPTYFKDMESAFLSAVWNKCDRSIADADRIVFCGYSFPDADVHIKYLIKRQQVNRSRDLGPVRITVVNNHPGKTDSDKAIEKERFRRFLGRIDYSDAGFEQFAANPENYLR